jgi:hypothetical protein
MEKLTEKEIQKILSTDIEQLLNNPKYADLLNKIPATIKASREAREKEMKRILITGLEEMSNNPEFKEAFSLPVEELFNTPKHSDLLEKFVGIIREEPKVEATATTKNPDHKDFILKTTTEEAFSLAGGDLSNSPKQSEATDTILTKVEEEPKVEATDTILTESERETIYSASLEEMLYNPYVIDLLKKITATIKASR